MHLGSKMTYPTHRVYLFGLIPVGSTWIGYGSRKDIRPWIRWAVTVRKFEK